jgi:hypothetical protein
METEEEIRAKIVEARRRREEALQESARCLQQEEAALRRKKLRLDLASIEAETNEIHDSNQRLRIRQVLIDRDDEDTRVVESTLAHRMNSLDCSDVREESVRTSEVVRSQYVWTIGQMSWLRDAFEHSGETSIISEIISVGKNKVFFEYSPDGGDCGTMAITARPSTVPSITFRYKIFVRHAGGEFRLWGDGHASECDKDEYFGPDVPYLTRPRSTVGS